MTKAPILLGTTAILTSIVACYMPQAQAAYLPIVNAGFENPVQEDPGAPAPGNFTSEVPPGWSLYDPDDLIADNSNFPDSFIGVWNPSTAFFPDGVPEGDNVGFIYLTQDTGEAALSQVLSSTLAPNTKYTLQVKVGDPESGLDFYSIFNGFPGYRIELLAGGAVLAQDNNSLTPPASAFVTSTVSFTTSANHPNLGTPLEIRLYVLAGEGREVNFDDVTLETESIPEPLTILGASAAIGFGTLFKRKITKK